MRQRTHLSVDTLAFISIFTSSQLHSASPADEMFDADSAHVNEGSLVFLAKPPEKKAHQHKNQISISASSLQDGWVSTQQCHANIDAIDNIQITYNKDTTRKLNITSSSKIGKAWVENSNIELRKVKQNANLCVDYETRALHFDGDGELRLRTGPYMRQFLDGYYPINVILDVRYPCEDMHFVRANHPVQPGFDLSVVDCEVRIDTWFEGKLISELMFVKKARKKRP